MKVRRTWCAVLLAFSAGVLAAAPPGVQVQSAWIRWLPAKLPAAAYAAVVNGSSEALRITRATSPDYRDVMLMQSKLAQDSSTMVMIPHFDVPADGRAKFSPGAYHIMLSNPTRPVKPGDEVPITLWFADGSEIRARFAVMPADASGPGPAP